MTATLLDDADLASWFASGDADAVRVVYQRYGRLVFSVAHQVLGDVGLAEDATQQTFVQAWRAADSFDPARALPAWLTTIARRAAIDVHRRGRGSRSAVAALVQPPLDPALRLAEDLRQERDPQLVDHERCDHQDQQDEEPHVRQPTSRRHRPRLTTAW